MMLGLHTLLRETNNKNYFVMQCKFFTVVKNLLCCYVVFFFFVYKHLIYFRPLKDLDPVCVVNSV